MTADALPRPDWVPVDPFPPGSATRSYVSGETAADRTRVRYFRAADSLHACVWFGPPAEGPPDSVHGGAIAAVLDEAMGAVCWMLGHRVVGARISVNYLQRTPLGFDGWVEARIERIDGRKVYITARLMDRTGAAYADAEGLFVKLRSEVTVEPGVTP